MSRPVARPLRLPALGAIALGLALVFSLSSSSATMSSVLVGTDSLYGNVDGNAAGVAEAFRTSSTGAGTVANLRVFVDASAASGALAAGLYDDSSGHPGALLAAGSIPVRTLGGWNVVPLSTQATVSSGRTYWIAILSPRGSGTVKFRDAKGNGAAETSGVRSLYALQSRWSVGKSSRNGPASAYAPAAIDATAPTAPTGLTTAGSTQTSITTSWSPATDNVGVAGYDVYLDGAKLTTTASTSHTYGNLACGAAHVLAVDAFDEAGNTSTVASTSSSTLACSDSTAPSSPGTLTAANITQTGITLSWAAATDNVGVTGYDLYLDGKKVAATSLTSYTYGGLACATSHTLAIDAHDAAANTSSLSSITASTAACTTDGIPPSTPTGLLTGPTQTSVALNWSASTDNVGVTGYEVYLGASLAGSTAATGYTVSGLNCATSYTLAVDAVDAAGNRSAKATIGISTSACSPQSPSGSSVANLWVDSSGGTCGRQASAGGYSDASACGTFNAAFQAAQNGDAIRVKGGSYGDQTIGNRSGSAAPGVTIAPASGESVTLGEVSLCGADYLTLNGPMKLKSVSNYDCYSSLATNITLDGVTVDWGYDASQTDGSIVGLYGNVANFTMRNSTIEHGYNVKGFYMSSWSSGTSPYYYPTNIVLENSSVHSWNAASGIHTECVFANKAQGLTLRGDHFYDCLSTGDGIVGNAGLEPNNPRDYVFENNVFELSWNNPACPCNQHGISFDGDASSLRGVNVFRYNLFETSMFTGSGPPAAGTTVDFYGNIGAAPPCAQVSHSSYNIWTNKTCSSSDKLNTGALAAANFVKFPARPSSVSMPVDLAPGDWHYLATVPAINAGNPDSNCSAVGQIGGGTSPCRPSVDKDGKSRPLGGRADAGPYEAQ